MLGFRYLSDEKLQGLSYYKYSCIETNPLTIYFFQPWWRTVVQVVPLWVAPNLLTLVGFLFHFSIFLLFSFYDYSFFATGSSLAGRIPVWVWLYSAVAHFTGHTLDGIDGKQARRTKSSSPLGELFDHGLDSVVCVFIPLILYSVVGRGQWGCSPAEGYWTAMVFMFGFYLSHWEKYITGTVYLPWVYDTGELVIPIVYFITGAFGVELWQFSLMPGLTCSDAFRYGIYVGAVFSVFSTAYNIFLFFKSSANYAEDYSTTSISNTILGTSPSSSTSEGAAGGRNSNRSFVQLYLPLLPMCLLVLVFSIWGMYSPSDVLEKDPRAFMLTIGMVFSNIACRLMISQMAGYTPDYINYLLCPVVLAMGISFALPQYELVILYGLLVAVLLAHLHYGCSVVYELCCHYNIYAFSLSKPPPH
ncbi:PREDICTED: ethanolaminephosphotransferase 1-like [Amphimedon queenslandica]|nr:PREDICTED: ethanolaminephosphotransferase 1-like [Amphimedon queenslandica]|eukprot:XP_019852769.1 PREDICTED: ethanolaminephosphotransferase 1-like [Amphimedon queenslandica]